MLIWAENCPECRGTGRLASGECALCHGTGSLTWEQDYRPPVWRLASIDPLDPDPAPTGKPPDYRPEDFA